MTGPIHILQQWLVGTGDDCDVKVTDEYASPHHCIVARTATGFWVLDIGSTNGTYIKSSPTDSFGTKVTWWTPIRPGETLVVGRSNIPWRLEQGG